MIHTNLIQYIFRNLELYSLTNNLWKKWHITLMDCEIQFSFRHFSCSRRSKSVNIFSRLDTPMIMSILLIVSYCVLLCLIVTYCDLLSIIAQIIDKPCMMFNEYELSCFIEYHRTTGSDHNCDIMELSNSPDR